MTVLQSRLLLTIDQSEEKTTGGIVRVPTNKKERGTEAWLVRAIVSMVAEGIKNFKKGDVVYVPEWEVQHATVAGTRYIVAKEEDVLLKL